MNMNEFDVAYAAAVQGYAHALLNDALDDYSDAMVSMDRREAEGYVYGMNYAAVLLGSFADRLTAVSDIEAKVERAIEADLVNDVFPEFYKDCNHASTFRTTELIDGEEWQVDNCHHCKTVTDKWQYKTR